MAEERPAHARVAASGLGLTCGALCEHACMQACEWSLPGYPGSPEYVTALVYSASNFILIKLSAMDVLAHASMKDAAKCDTHCELQILVNHQISERIWRRWDFPAARLFQCLLILSNIISPQIPDNEEGCCCCIIYNTQCCSSSFICVLVWWFRLRVANGDIFCVVLSLSL